jgi:hypothetical protein
VLYIERENIMIYSLATAIAGRDEAFETGFVMAGKGYSIHANPYNPLTWKARRWREGYRHFEIMRP